jgi:hypothetical protein
MMRWWNQNWYITVQPRRTHLTLGPGGILGRCLPVPSWSSLVTSSMKMRQGQGQPDRALPHLRVRTWRRGLPADRWDLGDGIASWRGGG